MHLGHWSRDKKHWMIMLKKQIKSNLICIALYCFKSAFWKDQNGLKFFLKEQSYFYVVHHFYMISMKYPFYNIAILIKKYHKTVEGLKNKNASTKNTLWKVLMRITYINDLMAIPILDVYPKY